MDEHDSRCRFWARRTLDGIARHVGVSLSNVQSGLFGARFGDVGGQKGTSILDGSASLIATRCKGLSKRSKVKVPKCGSKTNLLVDVIKQFGPRRVDVLARHQCIEYTCIVHRILRVWSEEALSIVRKTDDDDVRVQRAHIRQNRITLNGTRHRRKQKSVWHQ